MAWKRHVMCLCSGNDREADLPITYFKEQLNQAISSAAQAVILPKSMQGLVEIPYVAVQTIIYGVITYFMINFERTAETLPMHPVRELQERCQQQAEGLEYKATRSGNLATVEVYIDGIQVGTAQNQQKKMV